MGDVGPWEQDDEVLSHDDLRAPTQVVVRVGAALSDENTRPFVVVVPGAQRCTLCGRRRGHHHPRIAGHPFQVDVAIEDTWPGKLGRINYDPTYGSIDKDIQEFVAKVYGTKDVSRRAAVENTLQEKRERGETLILDTSGSIL